MADTIAVMNAGRIEQLGDPATLYERPAIDLRRQLPRPVQPARGHGHRPPPRRPASRPTCTATRCSSTRAACPTASTDVWLGVRPEKLAARRGRRAATSCAASSPTRPSPVSPRSTSCGCRGATRSSSSSRTTGRPGGRSARTSTSPGSRPRVRARRGSRRRRGTGGAMVRRPWLRPPPIDEVAAAPATAAAGDAATGCPTLLLAPGPALARRLLRAADGHPGVAVAAGGQRRRRLRLHRQRRRSTSTRCRSTGRSSSARSATPPRRPCSRSLLGYPLAYYIAQKAGRWKNVLLVLVVAPFFTSFLIRTLAWRTILSDDRAGHRRLRRAAHHRPAPVPRT